MTVTDRYVGKTVAFLTQHGKTQLIGPTLEAALGCTVVRAEGYDTDFLGTFSGEIKRLDDQLQTARMKARIGMGLTGASLGIASEGSFVADPFGGLMPWNVELLIWIDDQHQLEIVGIAQGPARSQHRFLSSLSELETFALEAGFPEHHLILRPQSESDLRLQKGLSDWHALKQAFSACQQQANNQLVYAENDHRAFCDPTRQSMIRRAAEDLLRKIQSSCPVCDLPGFSITSHAVGLPCCVCGSATRLAKSHTWQCNVCDHRIEQSTQDAHADARCCQVCNP